MRYRVLGVECSDASMDEAIAWEASGNSPWKIPCGTTQLCINSPASRSLPWRSLIVAHLGRYEEVDVVMEGLGQAT